jgi:hypothetical protein
MSMYGRVPPPTTATAWSDGHVWKPAKRGKSACNGSVSWLGNWERSTASALQVKFWYPGPKDPMSQGDGICGSGDGRQLESREPST